MGIHMVLASTQGQYLMLYTPGGVGNHRRGGGKAFNHMSMEGRGRMTKRIVTLFVVIVLFSLFAVPSWRMLVRIRYRLEFDFCMNEVVA